jgi:hypothetical protein
VASSYPGTPRVSPIFVYPNNVRASIPLVDRNGLWTVALRVISIEQNRVRVAIFLAPAYLTRGLIRVVVWSKYIDVEILRFRSPRQNYPCFPCSQNRGSAFAQRMARIGQSSPGTSRSYCRTQPHTWQHDWDQPQRYPGCPFSAYVAVSVVQGHHACLCYHTRIIRAILRRWKFEFGLAPAAQHAT